MKNKVYKLVILLFIMIGCISCFNICFAQHENVNANLERSETYSAPSNLTSVIVEEDTYKNADIPKKGDYVDLWTNDVLIDKPVDGSVYLFGRDIIIDSSVNGNVFILGRNVTINTESEISGSVYVACTNLEFKGTAQSVYSFSKIGTLEKSGYIKRDLKVKGNTFFFNGIVENDVYSNVLSFIEDNDSEKSKIGGTYIPKDNTGKKEFIKNAQQFILTAIVVYVIVALTILSISSYSYAPNKKCKNFFDVVKDIILNFFRGIFKIMGFLLAVTMLFVSVVGIIGIPGAIIIALIKMVYVVPTALFQIVKDYLYKLIPNKIAQTIVIDGLFLGVVLLPCYALKPGLILLILLTIYGLGKADYEKEPVRYIRKYKSYEEVRIEEESLKAKNGNAIDMKEN